MVRVVVIDAPSTNPPSLWLFYIFLSVIFIVSLSLLVSSIFGYGILYYGLLAAYAVFSVLLLWRPIRHALISLRVRSVASKLVVSSGSAYIPMAVDAYAGYLSIVSVNAPEKKVFTPYQYVRTVHFSLAPETHLLVFNDQGDGRVDLPGFMLSGKYDGVLILYFVPVYAVELQRNHIVVERAGERVDIFLQPTDTGFTGYMRWAFNRASGAHVFLSWPGAPVYDLLASTTGETSFVFPRIFEPTIIVSHMDFIDLITLSRAMGVPSLVQGEGNFRITIQVDIPFSPQILAEEDVSVVPRRVYGLS